MTDTTLDQVQHLIDQLTPTDQVRLLEYLASLIASVVKSTQFAEATVSTSKDAWRDFFRIGEEIESSDSPEVATLTSVVLFMRR